jgi:cytochrome P450
MTDPQPRAPASEPSRDDIASDREVKPSGPWWFEQLISSPRLLTWAARYLGFLFKLRGLTPVWRYDDVREVLARDEQFPVAWGERMIEVTQGRNFVLGMRRDDDYALSYKQLAEAFPLAEVPALVEPLAAKFAKEALEDKTGRGEIDAVEELIAMVPTRVCDTYFGIRMGVRKEDRVRFAKATYAISAYLFDTKNPATYEALGGAAAAYLRKTIRDSIAGARGSPQKDTVLQRMIDMGLDDDTIHAQLFGMITGFIPTNVMAGGNILETLLRRPEFLARARAAALADDDLLLWRCLREALRFRHINPGPWRICPLGYTVGEGGPSPTRIRPGRKVLALIQTAMFDRDRIEDPYLFNPLRGDENYMVFGFGQHWCVGFSIARGTATQTFKPLLKLKRLAAARCLRARVKRFNSFYPLHLDVGFEP